jgi:mitochondrial import inner membrane translocase subunit TIM17
VLGGNFGVWGGLFSTYDCAVKGIRKKEDPYNASESLCTSSFTSWLDQPQGWSALVRYPRLITLFTVIAGFFTGGSLAIRGGLKAARNGAIMCAIFLAVIEGVGIGFQRMMAEQTRLDVRGILHTVTINSQDADDFTRFLHLRRHQIQAK